VSTIFGVGLFPKTSKVLIAAVSAAIKKAASAKGIDLHLKLEEDQQTQEKLVAILEAAGKVHILLSEVSFYIVYLS